MLKEAKVVEARVNNKEFEEYCEKNGFDPKHKLSRIKFMAEVLNSDDAKGFLELYEKGEIGLDAVKMCENGKNMEVSDTDFVKGFDMFVKGAAKMYGCEALLENSKLDKLSKESKMQLVKVSADTFGNDLIKMLECVQNGSQMLYINEKVRQVMKEDEENDKKA